MFTSKYKIKQELFPLLFQWSALHDGIVTTCDFSYDGKFLITGSDLENSVRIWDAYDGELIKELKCKYDELLLSNDKAC